ncbi:MAG: hypothetical protein ACMUIU_13160 [bacterium]
MAELKELLKKKIGDKGVIDILNAIKKLGTSAVTSSKASPNVKMGAQAVSNVLGVVIGILDGKLNADNIDLDELFVKSPDELLAERGITQDEIDSILKG